jgi:hypothetical protein
VRENQTENASGTLRYELLILWSSLGKKVTLMAKVKSDRDLVDSGIRALVEALGYSGAARFLRHFSKGEGDYLVIQEKIFKGMDLEEIYKRAEEHHRPGKP